MESITVAIEKFKVEPDTAMALRERFEPFETQAIEWAEKAKDLTVTDITQTDKMASAREARLALRGIRINIENLHKELKEDSLKKGQLLDLIKRTLTGFIEPTERFLKEQEDFEKTQIEKERAELRNIRLTAIREFSRDYESIPVEDLTHDAFENIIRGLKVAKEQREQEELDLKLERERIELAAREENERLKKQNELLIAEQRIKLEQEGKEREKLEIKLKKEHSERLRLEYKQREKERLEADNLKAAKAAERKAKRAPDREKLLSFAEQIQLLEPPNLKDDEAKSILMNAQSLLAKVIKYINDNTEKL